MGDPRKRRKSYSTPVHPWNKIRIDEERELKKEYGTKSKKEIYKINSKLKKFAGDAKKLVALRTTQAEKEKQQMLDKLQSLGLLPSTAQLADVLGLKLGDMMERRLQTLLFRKGMARSMNQARQFIIHRHVMVNGKTLTQPSYLVRKQEEGSIAFSPRSTLSNPEHPERKIEEKEEEKKEKPKKKPMKKDYHKKEAHKKEEKKEAPKKEEKKEEKKEVKKEAPKKEEKKEVKKDE